ncbi:MAG: 5'-methylthioadenosine/adenosylhomocysteine nucleosidase [Planctomycetes bacterium]|nr:5'-methylthioadenosine/adenosylhomocysteine nucleosidase [Planctomycetota bacterium]
MNRMKCPEQVVLLILVTLLCACAGPTGPTAILGAFDEETAWIEKQVENRSTQKVLGIEFITGRLGDQEVVIALTGVGKVNAAMTTTLLIDHFHPQEVIFTGVAGSLNPAVLPGDIVIATATIQHDLGDMTPEGVQCFGVRNPLTDIRNPVRFESDPGLLERAEAARRSVEFEPVFPEQDTRMPRVHKGIIVTGDVFITSTPKKESIRHELVAEAVEMEGAAVAQVCYQHKVPCLVIRAISDCSDETAEQDFQRFFETAARNANRVVYGMHVHN